MRLRAYTAQAVQIIFPDFAKTVATVFCQKPMSQIRFYFSFLRKMKWVTPLMFATSPVTVAWVSGSIKRENKQKMGCPGIFAAYCITTDC
jgi:hypothetical protein